MTPDSQIPRAIGIIMDGNRRWAKERGLPAFEGHRQGFEKFKEVAGWARDCGIKNMIVYALSTENWQRTKEEVSYLLDLFRRILKEEVGRLHEEGVRVIFAGDISRFPDDVRDMMEKAHEKTNGNTKHTLVIAASYGGRAEILHAINKLLIQKEVGEEITEADVEENLWTSGVPAPDIIIRSGGEMRLSNFLPWQSVYSELFFSKTYWPDFSKEEFMSILEQYSSRQRRMGK